MLLDQKVAECVGLWLAEGDSKTISEITFTNNCYELIDFFYITIKKLFKVDNFRLYVYSPSKNYKINRDFDIQRVNYYIDKRARKPYFILRLASRKIVKEWNEITKNISNDKKYYSDILRGFFAGEGNIKEGERNRAIRIAQKNPIELINRILTEFEIEFRFSKRERSYVISSRYNWEKLAKIGVANLHPIKRKRFWEVYNKYKQWHYSHNFIRDNILELLENPTTSKELSEIFERHHSRIQHVLIKLKKEGKIKCFRVRSQAYWTRNDNLIIISKRKKTILDLLNKPRRTFHIANKLKIDQKTVFKRLNELNRLGLVDRKNKIWYKLPTNKEVLIL